MAHQLKQRTHLRLLQSYQLRNLQHLLISKVRHKQVNQPSHLVTLQFQWMMMCQQPLKMDQLPRPFQVKELTLLHQTERLHSSHFLLMLEHLKA